MKALKLILALLCTLTILPVSAEETVPTPEKLTMDNVTMQCIYDGGVTIAYDGGTSIYLSDTASESDNANTSLPISNKYLLASTKYLKSEIFKNNDGGKAFKCPQYLQVAKVLNEEEEAKSYSAYYFLTGAKDKFDTNYQWRLKKYILFFSADRMAEYDSSVKIADNNITINGVSPYNSDNSINTTFAENAIAMNKKLTDEKTMTLEDIYGVGYAMKAVTEKSGWLWFGADDAETYKNSLTKMVGATKINEVKELKKEKVFISKDANSAIDCNYTTISDQAITTKQFMTASIYKNGSVLIEGNHGIATGNDTNNRNIFSAAISAAPSITEQKINPADGKCPATIYVKFPAEEIEYGKTTPTVSYQEARYIVKTSAADGYVQMNLLPEGEANTFDKGRDVCNEFLPATTIVLKEIIAYLTILVPVAVVVLIIVDYVKVVKANADSFDDANKKQLTRIKTRLALIAFFLLLRPLINFVLNILHINGLIEVSNIDCLFF